MFCRTRAKTTVTCVLDVSIGWCPRYVKRLIRIWMLRRWGEWNSFFLWHEKHFLPFSFVLIRTKKKRFCSNQYQISQYKAHLHAFSRFSRNLLSQTSPTIDRRHIKLWFHPTKINTSHKLCICCVKYHWPTIYNVNSSNRILSLSERENIYIHRAIENIRFILTECGCQEKRITYLSLWFAHLKETPVRTSLFWLWSIYWLILKLDSKYDMNNELLLIWINCLRSTIYTTNCVKLVDWLQRPLKHDWVSCISLILLHTSVDSTAWIMR